MKACEVARGWSLARENRRVDRRVEAAAKLAARAVEGILLRVARLSGPRFAYRQRRRPALAEENSRVRGAGTRFLTLVLTCSPLLRAQARNGNCSRSLTARLTKICC